jgi:hypothetical protein
MAPKGHPPPALSTLLVRQREERANGSDQQELVSVLGNDNFEVGEVALRLENALRDSAL